ncbi:MAG: hypothetical protein ACI8ZM_003299 [Crocinitomix sp.]|jgi:hypothetical protein
MKLLTIVSLLLSSFFLFGQFEKINEIKSTLQNADTSFFYGQFDEAILHSKSVFFYDYENLEIPQTSDEKMDYFRNNFFVSYSRGHASFVLAQSYYNQNQYDSCLVYLKKIPTAVNFSSIRNFTYGLEKKIHLAYLESVCYEKNRDNIKAKEVLVQFLFLDRVQTGNERWFSQIDLVNRYKALSNKSDSLNENSIVFMPKDSVKNFAWSQYYGVQYDLYYVIDEIYCPILPSFENQELNGSIYKNTESKNNRHPFTENYIEREIDLEKMLLVLSIMKYFSNG